MNPPVPDESLPAEAQVRLDHLIARVGDYEGESVDLVRERLQSARRYLLGGMPEEYSFSLHETILAASNLTVAELRKAVVSDMEYLLSQAQQVHGETVVAPPRRAPKPLRPQDAEKSRLYQFFRGTATTMGVFYPTHYVFASFPSLLHAQKASDTLRGAGHRDLIAASASETVQFMNEVRSETGIWGAMMSALSRFFGTEEVFTEIDLKKAEEGAGFLAVYCPRDDEAERIRDLVAPFDPLAIQLYLPGGVRSLWAGKSPGPQGIHPEGH